MEISEGEKKKQKKMFGTKMTENFPKLMPDTKPQTQEPQRTPR